MKENIIIYHGSKNRIEKPIYGAGNRHNDYGLGFYCTEEKYLANEWAVEKNRDGYCNAYSLELVGLSLLDLSDPQYNVLNWLTVLLQNRTFDIQTGFAKEAKKYLSEHFMIPYEEYDVIKGYRADDSYFSFAQDFLNNAISINQLSEALHLGRLGTQIVLKSKSAFERILFCESSVALWEEWYPKKEMRDQRARKCYFEEREKPWKKGEIYMMQILEEEVTPDDTRIR